MGASRRGGAASCRAVAIGVGEDEGPLDGGDGILGDLPQFVIARARGEVNKKETRA